MCLAQSKTLPSFRGKRELLWLLQSEVLIGSRTFMAACQNEATWFWWYASDSTVTAKLQHFDLSGKALYENQIIVIIWGKIQWELTVVEGILKESTYICKYDINNLPVPSIPRQINLYVRCYLEIVAKYKKKNKRKTLLHWLFGNMWYMVYSISYWRNGWDINTYHIAGKGRWKYSKLTKL